MLKQHITSKIVQVPAKAAAPSQGAAAFSCSTKNRLLPAKVRISKQYRPSAESIGFYNFLGERHYFRRNCAKHPIANVVLTEGQTKSAQMAQEVTAWVV